MGRVFVLIPFVFFSYLIQYINTVGALIRSYLSAQAGTITFFAPMAEAFDRIPDEIEKRLLRDRIWLEQVHK